MRNYHIHQIIISILTALLISCSGRTYTPSAEFDLNLRVTNPIMPLKLSLGIKTLKFDSTLAVLYVNRIDGHNSVLDYHDPSLLRKNISDTALITREEFSELAESLWDMRELREGNESTPISDHFFSIVVKDRDLSFEQRSFNESLKGGGGTVKLILELFDKYFPVIPDGSTDSKILLKKNDSSRIAIYEFTQSNDSIRCSINDKTISVSRNAFLNVWSVIDNNQAWKLPSDHTYVKFPLSYHLVIQRDTETAEWVVHAPHLLSDKRYYAIVNAIETIEY